VQTLAELRAELVTGRALGLRIDGRLVGAVRTREEAGVLHVNRLTVAPDLQGAEIGSRLLHAAEDGASAPVAELLPATGAPATCGSTSGTATSSGTGSAFTRSSPWCT
jgi:hypothetical protein